MTNKFKSSEQMDIPFVSKKNGENEHKDKVEFFDPNIVFQKERGITIKNVEILGKAAQEVDLEIDKKGDIRFFCSALTDEELVFKFDRKTSSLAYKEEGRTLHGSNRIDEKIPEVNKKTIEKCLEILNANKAGIEKFLETQSK